MSSGPSGLCCHSSLLFLCVSIAVCTCGIVLAGTETRPWSCHRNQKLWISAAAMKPVMGKAQEKTRHVSPINQTQKHGEKEKGRLKTKTSKQYNANGYKAINITERCVGKCVSIEYKHIKPWKPCDDTRLNTGQAAAQQVEGRLCLHAKFTQTQGHTRQL